MLDSMVFHISPIYSQSIPNIFHAIRLSVAAVVRYAITASRPRRFLLPASASHTSLAKPACLMQPLLSPRCRRTRMQLTKATSGVVGAGAGAALSASAAGPFETLRNTMKQGPRALFVGECDG